MEVVSTSDLASSENEKTTTACNFQILALNSFVIPHDLMTGQIGSYPYMQTQNYSYFHEDRAKKKRAKKHILIKQQNQN